ncbi:hypothetical protein NAAC61_04510 [Petrotoga sp. 8T1HF07.NaAc.6.1]|nr:hypothetical protein [Petrotoga sp. 8T1HF07.NaAc.6.1]
MGGLPNENEEIKIFFLMGGERGERALIKTLFLTGGERLLECANYVFLQPYAKSFLLLRAKRLFVIVLE